MTISGTYTQTLSISLNFTAVRVQTAAERQPAATASGDTVTLSPEATAPSSDELATVPESAPAPESTPAPATKPASAQKADALLAALDADGDGEITKKEFTDGALALLGRERRDDRDGDDRVEGHDHHSHRLERRLRKLFKKVDADRDGSIDAQELTSALAKAEGRGGRHECCGHDTAASQQAPAATTASYASVTVVAVAVKQYAAVSAAA